MSKRNIRIGGVKNEKERKKERKKMINRNIRTVGLNMRMDEVDVKERKKKRKKKNIKEKY